MQMKRKRTYRFAVELVVVFLFIFFGMIMIGRAFAQHSQIIINEQDEQLFFLAKAVDRNIDSILDGCEKNLDYVTGRRGFLEAEQKWRDSGETAELLFRMEENSVTKDELVYGMLAMQDGKIILSTDGKQEYLFLPDAGSETLRYCTDGHGTVYLAVIKDAGEGLCYAALMDLNIFYRQIVGDELARYDWVILTDTASEILLYHQNNQLKIEEVDAVTGATCGQDGVNFLLDQQRQQLIGTSSYEYTDRFSDEDYTARIVTLPTNETANKAFAIGVVTNFEEVMLPLRRAGVRLLCYGGMIAIGIIILVGLVMRFRRRDEQNLRELQILREKNEAMEELNRKTRELAHHQRLETIGTLTSGIAHEFNNLLTPIMGYSIMTLEELSPEQEELYDNVLEIYQASLRAKDIIARLSELSRKNTPDTFGTVHMAELVEKVQHVAAPSIPKGVSVRTEIDCRGTVLGNETQLSQMLLNLMINAFHAMEKEGGLLTISLREKEGSTLLQVKDTGCGIPKKNRKEIFEPFFTTKETGKGTGLGLAIVRQVVSEHKGRIKVDSQEGKGAAFTVELPLQK